MTNTEIQQLSTFRLMREYSRRFRKYLREQTSDFYIGCYTKPEKRASYAPYLAELNRRGLRHVADYLYNTEQARESWQVVRDNAELIQADCAAKMLACQREEEAKHELEHATRLHENWWRIPMSNNVN